MAKSVSIRDSYNAAGLVTSDPRLIRVVVACLHWKSYELAKHGELPGVPFLKSAAASTEHRVSEVARLIVAGHRRTDVVDHCREVWGLAPRSADRLLAQAREQLRADWDIERPQMIADLLSQLSTLQQDARDAGNHAAVLGCINAAARIACLF